MNLTNSQIRAKARAALGGNIFAKNWLMGLLLILVLFLILGTASSITCGIGAIIIAGPLMFGFYKSFLDSVRTAKDLGFDNAFDGFKMFGKTFVLCLMQTLFIFLWSLLFVIPGMVKSYAYSMAFYIMADHPEYTWSQCLDESQKMMKGYKWKLFCLQLSFIGWLLIGELACGIGVLWVYPYEYTAITVFYNERKAEYDPAPIAEEPVAEEANNQEENA